MGVVYRAYHVPLARTGAVKVMHGISPDPDTIARFRREAQAIAQMRHPNILNVFDFGEYQGTPYMIVEYVPGGSLAAQMKKGPLETPTALEYLEGIASGLDYAHSLGIVHRDVKPANVLVARDGTPIIADFGLVKLLQSASLNSMTGATTGTPAYMAPEQVTGSKVGPAADRYSLATMAYEMLTGAFPFEDDSVLEMMYAHVHRDPNPPSSHRSELGPRVDAVLLRGLAKDPDARWESCEALVAALRSAVAAAPSPAVERTVVMAPPVAAIASVARPNAAPAEGTVVMPLPVPADAAVLPGAVAAPARAATKAPARSRKRLYAILTAVVLLLLISSIGLIIASGTPTLSLSSTAVSPGDTLVVSAAHVPKNQAGEIQLLSRLTTYGFRADGNGNVAREILVPNDTLIGDHLVKICWNATCHAQATLHVVPFGAVVITSPTPGASPAPGSTPGGTSTPRQSPTPTHATSPTPSPLISISNYTIKILTGTETVYGLHFAAGSYVTITFIQGSTTNKQVGVQTVSSSGYFSQFFTVPATAVVGPAAIRVCGSKNSPCLWATVNVSLTG